VSQIYIRGPAPPPDAPSGKMLIHPKVAVTFQVCSSFCVRLMESSLYNRVCTKRSPKMGFWGDSGGRGKDIWLESIPVLRIPHFQTSLVQI